MNRWIPIFLLLLEVFATSGAEDCDKTKIYDAMRDLRNKLQTTKASNYSEAFNLYKSMLRYENGVDVLESQIESCPEKIRNQLKAVLQLAFGIATEDADRIQSTMKIIDDDRLLEEFVALHYAVDSYSVIKFLLKAPSDESLRVYEILTSLLKKTDLNNTEINTNIEVINHINQELKTMKDGNERYEYFKTLLREFIKTDLVLQHDNIERFVEIDKDLTKDVINEIILYHTSYPIETHEQLALFPLLLIIKCPSNINIWIDHLHMMFEILKSKNDMSSMQALFLLKDVDGLMKLLPNNKVLLDIRAQIPDVMQIILNGNVCVKSQEVNKPINMYLINADSGRLSMVNFTPNPNGPHTIITGPAGGFNFTLVLSTRRGLDNMLKYYRVERIFGNLGVLSIPEFCNKNKDIVLQACVSVDKLLPSGLTKPQHLGVIKQLGRNIDRILKDTLDESCESPNTAVE